MNISERLRQVMAEGGATTAITFEDRTYSWSRLGAFSQALSRLLEAIDPAGSPAALVLRNRAVGAAAMFGLLAARRTGLMITPIQPAAGVCADVLALKPGVVIAEREDWTPGLDDAARSIGARGLEIFDRDGELTVSLRLSPTGDDSRADSNPFPNAAVVMSTSGTTGAAKRVPLTWEEADSYASRREGPVSAEPRPLVQTNPLVTIGGIYVLLACAAQPLHLVLMERLDVRKWADLVERFKLRRTGLPPAGLRMLLESGVPKAKFAHVECFTTGSAPFSADEIEKLESTYGKPLLYSYGATELGTTPVARWTLDLHREWGAAKRGSVGRAVEGVSFRVVDPVTCLGVPAGEEGVLEVSRATALVAGEGGWIRTNDLAVLDQDGFLFIKGRADDVIIRGGFKVPLSEVEACLLQHDGVRRVAAVGLPDARLGEVPAAAVVLSPEAKDKVDEAELMAWARERLAPYKRPTRIKIVEELPLTQMLKVSRPQLRQLLTA